VFGVDDWLGGSLHTTPNERELALAKKEQYRDPIFSPSTILSLFTPDIYLRNESNDMEKLYSRIFLYKGISISSIT
jgi:hypothetical protein